MVYTGWSSRVQAASDGEWVSLRKLRDVLKFLDAVKLAINASRQSAIDYLANLEKEAPFAVSKKFPEYETWVYLDSGDWPNKFSQIVTALNFKELSQTREGKERHSVKTRGGRDNGGNGNDPHEAPEEEPREAVPNDVLLSFTSAIKNIRLQIGRREGLFDDMLFRQEYRVTWEGEED